MPRPCEHEALIRALIREEFPAILREALQGRPARSTAPTPTPPPRHPRPAPRTPEEAIQRALADLFGGLKDGPPS